MRFALFLFLALVFPGLPVMAQEGEDSSVFQVSDGVADVTADSAAHARDKAILQAQRDAFSQLGTRLGGDVSLAQGLNDDAIAAFVQAFEVQQERLSKVRYIGTFTVQFKPGAVRSFLGQHGTTITDVRSKPVIVLPVVSEGKRFVLWEERTPWRAAWDSVTSKGGLVPIIVPSGELDDIAMITGLEAAGGKPEAIAALLSKYQAGSVAVPVLQAEGGKLDPKQTIRVDVLRFDTGGKAGEMESLTLPAPKDEKGLMASLGDGVRQVRARLEQFYRQSEGVPKGPLAHLPMVAPIASLAEWANIKTRLANVSFIKRVNVISLTRGAADIDIEFHGDFQQLQASLAEQGLVLEHSPATGAWMLQEQVEPVIVEGQEGE